MNTLLKKCSVIIFLSLFIHSKGQVFTLTDSIPTTISQITYEFLPVQSDNGFNFLFYSTTKEKQDFELLTIKDTTISRMPIKNKGLAGGGRWYNSAVISNEKLLLLYSSNQLLVYEKNKKGNYVFKETLTIKGRDFDKISLIDDETVLLANSYNFYTGEKLYDNYALCAYNSRTKKAYQIEMDLGKGILLSHFATTELIESKKDKIAVAHPTLPFVYIYNSKLQAIDTVYASFQSTISVNSVINTVFTDSFIEQNRFNPKTIIETIEKKKKIDQMERIEKVFWLSDDILGYTIRQPFSDARMFVFYSISEKKELLKKICEGEPYNFLYSGRILINNNKTIYYDDIYTEDESDMYYKFYIYDLLPFGEGTK